MLSVNVVDNSPSFKQISIVRVPKKAFQYPEKLTICSLEFGEALDNLNGNKNNLISDLLSVLIGKGKNVKTAHNLEGAYGTRFTNVPLEEDMHTFSIFTGEEKDQVAELFSFENALKIMHKIKNKGSKQDIKDFFANKICEIFANRDIQEFRIKNLDGLKELKTKIGL